MVRGRFEVVEVEEGERQDERVALSRERSASLIDLLLNRGGGGGGGGSNSAILVYQ